MIECKHVLVAKTRRSNNNYVSECVCKGDCVTNKRFSSWKGWLRGQQTSDLHHRPNVSYGGSVDLHYAALSHCCPLVEMLAGSSSHESGEVDTINHSMLADTTRPLCQSPVRDMPSMMCLADPAFNACCRCTNFS
jgi:hypothetical protein